MSLKVFLQQFLALLAKFPEIAKQKLPILITMVKSPYKRVVCLQHEGDTIIMIASNLNRNYSGKSPYKQVHNLPALTCFQVKNS